MRTAGQYRPSPGGGRPQSPTRSTRFPSERAPDRARGMSGAGTLQVEMDPHPASRRGVAEVNRDAKRDNYLAHYRAVQDQGKVRY